ncbi:krev interaction trapped protein 1-like [Anneissia japonica]|uniref:krev interaction trapped protein 1-like n=1 Tax=Anneissia japonica TaxID=1529436 RepID=UPI0014255673|nr:krev interaction trapped protein 1-like [Anneissia japonica]
MHGVWYKQRSPHERLQNNVTNPGYVSKIPQGNTCSPSEALKKMEFLDHVDNVVINEFFQLETDLPVEDTRVNDFISVDSVVLNPFFGMGVPDYNAIRTPKMDRSDISSRHANSNMVDEYPLHSAAFEGNVEAIKQILSMGYYADQPNQQTWAPIHYAAYNGKTEAVKALLHFGKASPNIENEDGSTPLHFAAQRGFTDILKVLVAHRDIDLTVMDKEDRTALMQCEERKDNDWEGSIKILKEAMRKPPTKVDVHLMDLDGSHVVLDVVAGSNTTVSQLLKQLELPKGCHHVFAIWIASQSLHLQMRPEHKPILHIRQWDAIVRQLTNYNPETERPVLYLRRDALLSLNDERLIKDPQAIKMLFDECLLNVLKAMYPCSDGDAVLLAGIYMQIVYGDHDPKKHKAGFLNNINLRHFIPGVKLEAKSQINKTANWAQRISAEHKNVTSKGIRDITKLQLMYLEQCRSFVIYGSAFFFGFAQMGASRTRGTQRPPVAVFVGTNSRGIHAINAISKVMLLSCPYEQASSWNCSSDMKSFHLKYRDSTGSHSLIVKTKQAAIICNLANKLSGRFNKDDQSGNSSQRGHSSFRK